ncbi:hypothetical protein GmHk_17G049374 [Glycine max]|nr:hypothetical protein GmHk_17G049374 [Glycine max]
MHLGIIPSVHNLTKIEHLKRVVVCTQVILLACGITPFAWYGSLVDLHTLMRSFSKLIYERILVNLSMIDLGKHMSDVSSSVGESQITPLDPAEEQRLRTQCWVAVVEPKRKGYLYGTRDLAHNYKYGDDIFM